VVYSVGSDQNFATLVRFLQQFAVPWVIVCDGPVMSDPQPPAINIVKQLAEAGISGLPDVAYLGFSERCSKLAPFGVLTLAKIPDDEFEKLPIIQAHWSEAKRQAGRSKARIGYYIATHYNCPPEVADLLGCIMQRLEVSGPTGA
jgi:hypothetical protein